MSERSIVQSKLWKSYKKLLAENAELKQKKRLEFSKIILLAVMLTYFVGIAFGIYAVNKILVDYPEWAIQALIAMFSYIGVPIGVAIGFYSWKAKNENTLKIHNHNQYHSQNNNYNSEE